MSVAIRTAVRLQDQDDVNVTPAVGVDEYALTYDHDTAKFVLRAPFAGLLATGATTGATSQAQVFTNGVTIGSTGKLLIGNGSAAAPAIASAANTDCGIYIDPTWGDFGISIDGSPKLTLNGGGTLTVGGITMAGSIYTGPGQADRQLQVDVSDAVTDAVSFAQRLSHITSGTPSAGFGVGLEFELEDTTSMELSALITSVWNDATHATRKGDLVLTAFDTAEREGLRIRGNGSAPAIGFLGATPQARILHVADAKVNYTAGDLDSEAEVITAINTANGTINTILATLELFGFHAAS